MSRAIKAAAATDLRQGVTEVEHAVLDRAEVILRDADGSIFDLLSAARFCAAEAKRFQSGPEETLHLAMPNAREGAALLITALNRLEAEAVKARK